MSKKGNIGKRDIIQLLDYPSESESEVEVDAPRPKRPRTPTDRLVDHPPDPTIHRNRSQGVRLGSAQSTTNLVSNSITEEINRSSTIDTARETDMQVHHHDFSLLREVITIQR